MAGSFVKHSDPYFDNAPSATLFERMPSEKRLQDLKLSINSHCAEKSRLSKSPDALTGHIQTVPD